MLGFPGKPPGFSLDSLAIRDPAVFDVQRKRDPGQLNFLFEIKDFEKFGFRDDGIEYRPYTSV
jgi:hypothetical protein